jgi:class 3 adenylate cyclase
MRVSQDLALLETFVPKAAKWLSSHAADGCLSISRRRVRAALLFVDMNDFVKVSNGAVREYALATASFNHIRSSIYGKRRNREASARCAACLRDVLAEYFSRLTDVVSAYDGEVLAFIGDAMLAAWFVRGDMDDDEELRCATKRARLCAQGILTNVHGHALKEIVTIKLKAMISAGPVVVIPTKFPNHARGVVVIGDAFDDLRAMKGLMRSGKVVFNALSRALLASGRNTAITIPSIYTTLPPERVKEFIPSHVFNAFADGLIGFDDKTPSVSEMCTVAFVRFNPKGDDCIVECIGVVHRVVSQYQGVVLQSIVDENGPSCLCAFGVPRTPKRGAATRGLRFARDLLNTLDGALTHARCGLSTGVVNIGAACEVNSKSHSEFSLVGVPVILAARLADAVKPGVAAMDEETRVWAASALINNARTSRIELCLKGFPRAVTTFVIE